jgi:hypothetical protein
MKLVSLTLALFALTHIATLKAGTAVSADQSGNLDQAVQAPEQSIYDKIWGLAKIYKNNENPLIEEFSLIGRFQLDYFNVDSSKGNNDFLEIRRLRIGADSFLANRHLELKAELDTNLRSFNADEVFYNRFTNLYAMFYIADGFNVRVGKFEPRFGYDREFSDNMQKFFERSFFDDQVIGSNDYMPGAEITGNFGNWGYRAAVYSGNVNQEFGEFNGGEAFQAGISYDFSKSLGADKALWMLDYLHADGKNKNTNVFANYDNAVATYLDYQKGKCGLVTQLAYADGIAGKGDIYELMIMPSYLITDKLEAIFRYQLGASSDNGLTTLNRQEKTVGKFTGDTYNAFYLGLNYYLYGQKLKLMFGEQYANLGGGTGPSADYSGWTTLAGLRLFF